MRVLLLLITVFLVSCASHHKIDNSKNLETLEELASKGDSDAMFKIGGIYYKKGNYTEAMNWYEKSLYQGNFNAFASMGTMFFQGAGVPENKKIAYLIFLSIHMQGFGNAETQDYAVSSLRRVMSNMEYDEIQDALCYTTKYASYIVRNRGEVSDIPKDVLPSKTVKRYKDLDWWAGFEKKQMRDTCPEPWNL